MNRLNLIGPRRSCTLRSDTLGKILNGNELNKTDLVRDTRVLLSRRETGEVVPLTEKHHAEARVEAARLRRMGAGRLVSDSFGESRWMGAIENTRGWD